MTQILAGGHPLPAPQPRAPSMPVFAFCIVAVLLVWTQAQPFPSLQDYGVLNDPAQSNDWRRLSTVAITLACGFLVASAGRLPMLMASVGRLLPLLFAWFALTALTSPSPGLALNRLALAGAVVFIAFCLPLLFDRLERFVAAYGLAATVAIVFSFMGAAFLPDLAIHGVRDTVEQGLAGDWRGIFKHKNDLGPMAIHFIFVGLLLARTSRRWWGLSVAGAALALLVLSGAKSAALLLIPSVAGAAVVVHSRSRLLATAAALVAIGGLGLVTVGSVLFPALQTALARVLPDASFTGRSDVWSLALDAIVERPLLGYGYGVFWDTSLTYSVADTGDTAALMSHAHNGYLETAISAGLPGLALVLAWTIVLPLGHIGAIKRRVHTPRRRAFLEFLVQNWLFVLLISCLEAVLFNRGDAIWFAGVGAIAGLALWARAPLVE